MKTNWFVCFSLYCRILGRGFYQATGDGVFSFEHGSFLPGSVKIAIQNVILQHSGLRGSLKSDPPSVIIRSFLQIDEEAFSDYTGKSEGSIKIDSSTSWTEFIKTFDDVSLGRGHSF